MIAQTASIARMKWRAFLVATSLVFGLGACESQPQREPEGSPPGAARSQGLRLADTPSVVIGREGTPELEFSHIIGAFPLASGEIVVADGWQNDIRVFGPTGQFLRRIGRPGNGPGEFVRMSWLGNAGDTLFVFDFMNYRLTTMMPDGRVVGAITVARPGGPYVMGRLPSGQWLVTGASSPPRFSAAVGRWRGDTTVIGILPADGVGDVMPLGEFPAMTWYMNIPSKDMNLWMVGEAAFGARTLAVPLGERVAVGDQAEQNLLVYTTFGAVVDSVRVPFSTSAPPPESFDALRKRRLELARTPAGRAFAVDRLKPDALPALMPYFDNLIQAPEQMLWVEEYQPLDSVPRQYIRVGELGPILDTVQAPPRFRITYVGAHQVIGIHTNEDGVETVHVYPLIDPQISED